MTLPVKALVEATPNFIEGLEEARAFFELQDAASSDGRMATLKRKLLEMVAILAWSPANGRPARFLNANSAQARLRLAAVEKLAMEAGLPSLREYILDQHVALYAHSETQVILLAIRHHRQLTYSAGQG